MKILLFIILFPVIIYSQPMVFEPQGIPVDYNGWELFLPWMGGLTEPKLDFADLDNDRDFDMIIGDQQGNIWYLNNIGDVNAPIWAIISDFQDSINVHSYACPALGDMDADGDYDLFISSSYHWKLWYFENIGSLNVPVYELVSDSVEEVPWIINVALKDINNDTDVDLFSGHGYWIQYFENVGDIFNYNFILADTQIASINFGQYAKPYLGDLNNDGLSDIIVGDENGAISYLRNDGTPSQYNFTMVTQNLVPATGPDAAPTLTDIDGDGDLDLFVGIGEAGVFTPFGGIRYYENIGTPEVYNFELRTDSYFDIDAGLHSTPRLVDINADGDLDLFVSSMSGDFAYFENIGDEDSAYFQFIDDNYQGIYTGGYGSIDFADLDADGDYDLLVGYYDGDFGKVKLYENTGIALNPQFVLRTDNLLGPFITHPIDIKLCDIDNDYDYDLFIGMWDGYIYFYRNIGMPAQFNFDLETETYCNIDAGYYAAPYFFDIDYDNDYDLFIGYNLSVDPSPVGIIYYENTGSPANAQFTFRTNYWEAITIHSTSSAPCFADIDNDTDADLFIGSYDGGVSFWRNLLYNSVSLQYSPHPYTFTLAPCYPNPFNPTTTISFTLNKTLPVQLSVYNQLGQQVTTIINSQFSPGSYQFNWNAENLSSGMYYILLEAQKQKQTQKVILLK